MKTFISISLVFLLLGGGWSFLLHKRTFIKGEIFNGMTFIGSRNSHGVKSEESLYFTSDSNVEWTSAQTLCLDVLGNDASLVSLETLEEARDLEYFLEAGMVNINSFWTFSQYSRDMGHFWPGSGPIQDDLLAENEPSINSSDARMVAIRVDRSSFYRLHSQLNGTQNPLVCELKFGSSAEPIPCLIQNDLVLVVDSSGSIGADNWPKALQFAKDVAVAWLEHNATNKVTTRISFITYSTNVETIIQLNNNLNERQIGDLIEKAMYHNGGTNSHLALATAYNQHDWHNRTEPVPRNLVFLTDGQSWNPRLTKEEAEKLHQAKIRSFAIGIGVGVVREELLAIASEKAFVFMQKDFPSLKEVLKPLSLIMCNDQ